MYHLVPVTCLVLLAFGVLVLRYPVEVAFVPVAGFPVSTFLIAIAHEFARGIQQFNHQLLHVAYDSSYVLSLLGICLIMRAVIKRKRKIHVLAATLVAAIPLGYILTTQP
jgi:uncharacterized membrane protein YbaN (DUF454 family)